MSKEPRIGDVVGCTCDKLRRASRRLTQMYDRFLQPSGLRITQYSLLQHVRALGEVPISELAGVMVTDRTTLSRNLGPLIRQGYVVVAPGRDRRQRVVRITAEGVAIARQAAGPWQAAQRAVIGALGKDTVRSLHALLEATDGLAGGPDRP